MYHVLHFVVEQILLLYDNENMSKVYKTHVLFFFCDTQAHDTIRVSWLLISRITGAPVNRCTPII